MQQELIMLGCAALVGSASGADAAIWGMYKDAAHEGFEWPRFWRSVVIGASAGVLIQFVLHLALPRPSAVLLLFGLAYAAERGVVETWKTFFRDEDQSKYAIPMQFSLRGIPVPHRGTRVAAGFAYIGALLVAGLVISRFDVGTPTLMRAAMAGFMVGLVIAVGGAWKDAPVEGFETLKFFRSPVLTTSFSVLLFPLAGSVLLAAVAAVGYERAASENYKTFCFPARPRGKFAGKPVTHPEMLRNRRRFVPAYVAIRLGLVWFMTAVVLETERCMATASSCASPTPHGWTVSRVSGHAGP